MGNFAVYTDIVAVLNSVEVSSTGLIATPLVLSQDQRELLHYASINGVILPRVLTTAKVGSPVFNVDSLSASFQTGGSAVWRPWHRFAPIQITAEGEAELLPLYTPFHMSMLQIRADGSIPGGGALDGSNKITMLLSLLCAVR